MPNDYDKILKENFDELIPHLLRVVLGLDLPRLEDLKDKIQVTTEREMDNLKKVVHDDPALDYALHLEVQSQDEDLRARNFCYYGLFYQRYLLPLVQIVVYVGDAPPRLILHDTLLVTGATLNFRVIDLRRIPKDLFLQANTPESVILAVLADFGADRPEHVVRQILQHLLKLVGRVPRLKKYQKQLQVLARLRKLELITKTEIQTMPIHYEIETDGLYLEGIEKGLEQGIVQGLEKGIEKAQTEAVTRMLQQDKYTLAEITLILGVTEAFVQKIARSLGLNIRS